MGDMPEDCAATWGTWCCQRSTHNLFDSISSCLSQAGEKPQRIFHEDSSSALPSTNSKVAGSKWDKVMTMLCCMSLSEILQQKAFCYTTADRSTVMRMWNTASPLASVIPLILSITSRNNVISLGKKLKSIWFIKINIWISITTIKAKILELQKDIYNYTVDVLSMLKDMNNLLHIIPVRAFMCLWWSMDISKIPSFRDGFDHPFL